MKDPSEVQKRRCDFRRDAAVEKGLISPGEENLLVCHELQQVPLELQWGPQGPARVSSGKTTLHENCEGPHRIALQLVPGPKSSSGADAGP